MVFFFNMNFITPMEVDAEWYTLGYLALTNPGHMYTGFDEMREWLVERGHPCEIQGIQTGPADGGRVAIMVTVADEIALHFKLRWC